MVSVAPTVADKGRQGPNRAISGVFVNGASRAVSWPKKSQPLGWRLAADTLAIAMF